MGSLVVSAKFLGQGDVGFFVWWALEWEKVVNFEKAGSLLFAQKVLEKDSRSRSGIVGYLDFYISIEFSAF